MTRRVRTTYNLGTLNNPAPKNLVAAIKDRGLSRAQSPLRLVKSNQQSPVT
ncbi:hypothetical protein NSPZN2_10944 [Nitrospira defluvii]|uniref:Uncharacterized protein n=1 Tax=Nitrospira defluvii TaxID=330214 RepID=A0ABM8QMS0_9BACT|nr:hypothetical protein NSPZN2_10944 [Nitrospira defluvii]